VSLTAHQTDDTVRLIGVTDRFLASADAAFITGQAINVDGGIAMHYGW
jgi:NAD(P)-dependent dehydrogenase (short-subunit alcohol dehydrogenase family)